MFFDKIILFIIASYLVGSIPGPSVLFTITSSLRYGVLQTIFTILGQIVGNIIFIASLLFGMAAFVSDNYSVFSFVKYFGAAYLFYLAFRMFISDNKFQNENFNEVTKSRWKLFVEGLIVCLSNPKLFLYFAAFLPQFVVPGDREFLQLLVLGILSIPIGFSILLFYAYSARFVRKILSGSAAEKYLNKSSALLITVVAVLLLVYN